MRIEYHRTLLGDRVRNAAFHAALRQAIVKGKSTVADIGAGTGFLGFLAAKLGAARVDLYEAAEIAEVARKLLKHNRLTRCRIAQVHSTEVTEPDRVDVIVCETLGNYPFEENIIATLNDARARFLEPGGTIIPRGLVQFVAPVTAERYWRELSVWDEVGYGLDLAPAKAMSLNNIYVRWFEPGDLLDGGGAAAAWDEISFERRNKTTRSGDGLLAHEPARDDLRPGTVVAGGAGAWRHALDRAARSAHALGAALPAGARPDPRGGRTDVRRKPAVDDLLRARHQRDLDADRRRQGRPRAGAAGARPRAGVPAVSSVISARGSFPQARSAPAGNQRRTATVKIWEIPARRCAWRG